MLNAFIDTYLATAELLAVFAGGACAVLVFLVTVVLVLSLAGAVFDVVTRAIARRWRKKGLQPRSRIAKVILGAEGDRGCV